MSALCTMTQIVHSDSYDGKFIVLEQIEDGILLATRGIQQNRKQLHT